MGRPAFSVFILCLSALQLQQFRRASVNVVELMFSSVARVPKQMEGELRIMWWEEDEQKRHSRDGGQSTGSGV